MWVIQCTCHPLCLIQLTKSWPSPPLGCAEMLTHCNNLSFTCQMGRDENVSPGHPACGSQPVCYTLFNMKTYFEHVAGFINKNKCLYRTIWIRMICPHFCPRPQVNIKNSALRFYLLYYQSWEVYITSLQQMSTTKESIQAEDKSVFKSEPTTSTYSTAHWDLSCVGRWKEKRLELKTVLLLHWVSVFIQGHITSNYRTTWALLVH